MAQSAVGVDGRDDVKILAVGAANLLQYFVTLLQTLRRLVRAVKLIQEIPDLSFN